MRTDDQHASERLDRYWDSLVTGAESGDEPVLPPELQETVHWLQAAGGPHRPSLHFVDRLEERLMSQPLAAPRMRSLPPAASLPPAKVGRGAHRPHTHPSAPPRSARLVPAAFLVLAILVAVAGLGRDRWDAGLFGAAPSPDGGAGTLVPAAQPALPVVMEGGDAARTGVFPGAGPAGAASIGWSVDAPQSGGLIVAGDRFYYLALGATHELIAADVATGATIWSQPVELPVFFAVPTVANGLVYLPSPSGVSAFAAETGAVVWSHDLGIGGNTPSIAVADGLLFVTARDKTLRALDAATGAERWRAVIPDSTEPGTEQMDILASTASPAVADGAVYTVGNGGLLVAIAASDGHQLWTFQTAGDQVPLTPMADDGIVLVDVVVDEGLIVQAVDAEMGTLRWQVTGDEWGDPAAIQDGALYIGRTGDGGEELAAVSLADGATLWTVQLPGRAVGIGLANGVLYLAIDNSGVAGIELATRTVVLSATLGSVASVGIGHRLLLVTTLDGIVAVAGESGAATPAAASGPVDLSGLPACVQPREAPVERPTGTPEATLVIESMVSNPAVPGTVAQVLTEKLPSGDPAPAEAIAGIERTMAALDDCVVGRPDAPVVGGFFTDDFYRRGWGPGAGPGANSGDGPSWPNGDPETAPTIAQSVALDDGRIAVVVDFGLGANFRFLVVFTQVDDAWLIDEWYRIVDQYQAPKG